MRFEGRISQMNSSGGYITIIVWNGESVQLFRGKRTVWTPRLQHKLQTTDPKGISVVLEATVGEKYPEVSAVDVNESESFDIDALALFNVQKVVDVIKLPSTLEQIEAGTYVVRFQSNNNIFPTTITWRGTPERTVDYLRKEMQASK